MDAIAQWVSENAIVVGTTILFAFVLVVIAMWERLIEWAGEKLEEWD